MSVDWLWRVDLPASCWLSVRDVLYGLLPILDISPSTHYNEDVTQGGSSVPESMGRSWGFLGRSVALFMLGKVNKR